MNCTHCGAPVPEGSKFCGECGTPVALETSQQSPGGGYQSLPQGQYTQGPYTQGQYTQQPYDGTGQQTPPPYHAGQTWQGVPPEQPQKKKSAVGIVIALVLVPAVLFVGLLVFGAVAYLRTETRQKPDFAGNTSTQATVEKTDAPTKDKTDKPLIGSTEQDDETGKLEVMTEKHELIVTLDLGNGAETIDNITYELIELSSDAPEALRERIADFNGFIEEYCLYYPVESGAELYEYFTADYSLGLPYSESVDLTVHRADKKVLSFAMTDSTFTGGVHPYTDYTGFTFDAQTGDRIFMEDVVKDRDALAEAAYAEMMKEDNYRETDDALKSSEMEGILDLTKGYLEDDIMAFALTNNGIVLLYSDYFLGSYAAGRAEVHVPYKGNEKIFYPDYMEGADPDDDVSIRVKEKKGRSETKDLIEMCKAEGIDVTQGPLEYTDPWDEEEGCIGTYYIDGDRDVAHITFYEDGTFTAYYAHGGIEAEGFCEWNTETSTHVTWFGWLVKEDGSTFAEVYYYPMFDSLMIGDNIYMK